MRRLNRYVEEQAPWSLAKAGDDEAVARVLATLVEGLRVVAVLLHPWMPASTAKIRDALGAPDLDYAGAAPAGGTVRTVRAPAAAVPQARRVVWPHRMIDSHTHLAFAQASDDELVGAAREAGVTRMLTVGIDAESCRQALDASERFEDVWAAIGRHPNAATGFTDADLDELRELAQHPRCAAIGETGLDFYREGAPREDQERAFRAQIELARETAKPLVIHSREAEDATIDCCPPTRTAST